MRESDSRHMDDTKLLTFIDRELDAVEAIRVDEHLASCEMCRSRLVESRSDLDDLITRHRERKIATAPPPRPWADMSTEFDRLDGCEIAPVSGSRMARCRSRGAACRCVLELLDGTHCQRG